MEAIIVSELSKRIKSLRLSAGMTQEEFGKKFGIVKSTVSLYESGKSSPNDEIKKQICDYFNVSLDYLVGLSEEEKPSPARSRLNYNKISYWLSRMGYSDDEVAKKLGITRELLKRYLTDKEDVPYKILHSLSEICEVSTDCLIGLSEKTRQRDFDNVLPFQYDYKIAGKIKQLCQEHNIDTNSSYLSNLLSLSDEELFNLIEYGFVPHIDTITKLANEFNVSTDYLLCQIDEQEEKVLQNFKKLNADNKDIIIGEIKKCIKEQRFEESVAAEEPMRKAAGK